MIAGKPNRCSTRRRRLGERYRATGYSIRRQGACGALKGRHAGLIGDRKYKRKTMGNASTGRGNGQRVRAGRHRASASHRDCRRSTSIYRLRRESRGRPRREPAEGEPDSSVKAANGENIERERRDVAG